MIRPTWLSGMKGWRIFCDTCFRATDVFVPTARQACLDVERFGWRTRQPKDKCPDCAQ